jgi:hypothetical protein
MFRAIITSTSAVVWLSSAVADIVSLPVRENGFCHIPKEVMPLLVKKGSRTYLYQSFRDEGVVRTKYHGQLSPQQIAEHQHRKEEEAIRTQHYQQMTALLDDLDTVRAVHDVIIRAGLLVNNQYLRRSEIRSFKNGY